MRQTVRGFAAGAAALALQGCGHMSFAPPEVSVMHATPERSVENSCLAAPGTGDRIPRNLNGAQQLISNYVDAYRCTIRVAADGRQAFQVPGFLALAGSAAATALGGGPRWTIAGGAASAMFGAGSAYYDGPAQVQILSDGLEALDCIQLESVGIDAFPRGPRAQNAEPRAREQNAREAVEQAQQQVDDARSAVARADRQATETSNRFSGAQSALNSATAAVQAEVQSQSQPETQAQGPVTVGVPLAETLLPLQSNLENARQDQQDARRTLAGAETSLGRANAALARAQTELAEARLATASLGEVELSAEEQYFNLIAAVLMDVEVFVARRLSQRGTAPDGQAIADRILGLVEQARKAQELLDQARGGQTGENGAGGENGGNGEGAPAIRLSETGSDRTNAPDPARIVTLQIEVLRPKLEQCIARAQL